MEPKLKKTMWGWRVVHPVKNDDGTTNWINLLIGGWSNFFILLFILFVIFLYLFGTKELLSGCYDMAENPCAYCRYATIGLATNWEGEIEWGAEKNLLEKVERDT